METDDVGLREQLVERIAATGVDRPRTERLGEPRRLATDPPRADDAEELVVETFAEHEVEGEAPLVVPPQHAVALGDPAEQRKHQRDRELGRRAREDVRRVRDQHAVPRRRIEVDVVDTDAVVRDDPQPRAGSVEIRVVDPRAEERDDPVGAARLAGELEVPLQLCHDARWHGSGDVNPRSHRGDAIAAGRGRRPG